MGYKNIIFDCFSTDDKILEKSEIIVKAIKEMHIEDIFFSLKEQKNNLGNLNILKNEEKGKNKKENEDKNNKKEDGEKKVKKVVKKKKSNATKKINTKDKEENKKDIETDKELIKKKYEDFKEINLKSKLFDTDYLINLDKSKSENLNTESLSSLYRTINNGREVNHINLITNNNTNYIITTGFCYINIFDLKGELQRSLKIHDGDITYMLQMKNGDLLTCCVDGTMKITLIERLLSVRGNKQGKQVDLKEDEIKFLIDQSLKIIKEQKMLVELEAPLHVCGDIHGQYYDLLRIFEHCGYPGEYNYLFLGDYVDRGKQSLETVCLLLCYKIKYPEKVTLLRGNHESSVTNRIYGFYDECKRRYNVRIWRSFTDLFNYLPVAAIIDEKILCMHGGLSPELKNIQNIQEISRPTDIPDTGLLCDLLWSDPDKDVLEYDENDRGVSVIFGEKIVQDFNKKNDLDLIIRAHQVVDDGYEFFAQRQLITIFSAPNYCGEFDNSAGIMIIDESLTCSLKVLRPVENLKK